MLFRSHLGGVFGLVWVVGLAGCAAGGYRPSYGGRSLIESSRPFVSGQDGYHTYRIPSLLVTPRGDLLAFCEGRKNSVSDTGDIDMVVKRSRDLGRSWGRMQVVADHGTHTIGNPCPVVDRETGVIWLLLTDNYGEDNHDSITAGTGKGTRTVWVCSSRDDGETWSEPTEITAAVKEADWRWYATGPGCGIQTSSGRLVIPCDHTAADAAQTMCSHVIYSDDHGETWELGGSVGPLVNECQVVELVDGRLMLNMRNYAQEEDRRFRRAVAVSDDGGQSWSKMWYDGMLIEPICQASFVRFTRQPEYGRNRLLFANPASTERRDRRDLTVRMSDDEGQSWAVSKQLFAGPSAYSALAVLPDMTVGCLYECGQSRAYETITFSRFSIEWLTGGADRLERK